MCLQKILNTNLRKIARCFLFDEQKRFWKKGIIVDRTMYSASYLFHTSEHFRKDVTIFLSNYRVVTSTDWFLTQSEPVLQILHTSICTVYIIILHNQLFGEQLCFHLDQLCINRDRYYSYYVPKPTQLSAFLFSSAPSYLRKLSFSINHLAKSAQTPTLHFI